MLTTNDNNKAENAVSRRKQKSSPVRVKENISAKELSLRLFQSKSEIARHSTSNTISFYDIMPKYSRIGSEQSVVNSPTEAVRTYDFYFEKNSYVIEVEAARIKQSDGIEQWHFPSTKDEIIEDVLRHLLSTDQQLSFFEDNVGCQFTIYAIRRELEKYGKTRSNRDVRLSLKVLRKSNLSVYRTDTYRNGTGDPIFSGPFFTDATVIDLNDYFNRADASDDKDVKGLVKFHNMITAGIQGCDFRLLRYDICMFYKSDMARWLHKRISHRHTGADRNTPYRIKMSTIFNDGNWKMSPRMDKNKAKINKAIDEMMQHKQIDKEMGVVYTKTNSGSAAATDYLIEIYLSQNFVDHIIISNKMHRNVREQYQAHQPGATTNMLTDDSKDVSESEMLTELTGLGLDKASVEEICFLYDDARIKRNIDYSEFYRNKKLKEDPETAFNFGAFLYKAIHNDWGKEFVSSTETKSRSKNKEDGISLTDEKIALLTESQKEFVFANWEEWDTGTRKSFSKNGFRTIYFKEMYKDWIKNSENLEEAVS